MSSIIKTIIQGGNSEALIADALTKKEFIAEVGDYFLSFYEEMKKSYKQENSCQFVSDFTLFHWIADSSKNKVACKLLNTSSGELVTYLFNEYWHFFGVLFEAIERKEEFIKHINEAKFLAAYRCWILCYLIKYDTPCCFFSLLSLARPERDKNFLSAFFIVASKHIASGADDEFLAREMFMLWNECPAKTKRTVKKNLRKCRFRKNEAIKVLLYKTKVLTPVPLWLFLLSFALVLLVIGYFLLQVVSF